MDSVGSIPTVTVMPRTWRQCDHCLAWRCDVAPRSDYVGRPTLCGLCTTVVATPTKSRAEVRARHAPPQAGGHDPLAEFERSMACEWQKRADQR
jgi:hypothetical protein